MSDDASSVDLDERENPQRMMHRPRIIMPGEGEINTGDQSQVNELVEIDQIFGSHDARAQ